MPTDHHRIRLVCMATGLLACLSLTATMASAQALEISRSDSRTTRQAPSGNFTGAARVDMLFDRLHAGDATGGTVTFEPGARTAWHQHPGGQTLIVTAGVGRVQQWGQAVQEIRAGDVVRIPPGQKHWHGAAPQSAMTHLAITEPRDGTAVQWLEPVSEEQYQAVPAGGTPPAGAAPSQQPSRPSGELQQRLAPGMAALTDDVLYGDVWRRSELSPRDRSLVTMSVLIATGRTAQLAGHLSRGLDNGVQPREASGVLAQLAVYCGWPSAVSALAIYDQVYKARNVDVTALSVPAAPARPGTASSQAPSVGPTVAPAAPKFAQLTADVVERDLWQRPDLTPRDRSLVTIAAVAALGDDGELDAQLRRGVANGLTRADIAEALTHLAFYAGWGRASGAIAALARVPQDTGR